jgi:hypothetical protein
MPVAAQQGHMAHSTCCSNCTLANINTRFRQQEVSGIKTEEDEAEEERQEDLEGEEEDGCKAYALEAGPWLA